MLLFNKNYQHIINEMITEHSHETLAASICIIPIQKYKRDITT